MFKCFEFARSATNEQQNAATVLALLGEDIVYPGLGAAISDDDLITEALREYPGATERLAQMEEVEPDDFLYDAFRDVMDSESVLFDAA